MADHGVDIFVHQAGIKQLANHESEAAGCGEMVDIGFAVGIHAGEQRNDVGNFVEIVPVYDNAGGAGKGHYVHGVVGGAAGGHQADNGVDDRFFANHFAHRQNGVVSDGGGDVGGGGAGERFAHGSVGVDEGGVGHVQAHHFHHHLVGVGGAVEGAGARAVVRGHFAFKQRIAADFALGKQLAGFGFFIIGNAAGHRACGHENGGQMAEAQRADQ